MLGPMVGLVKRSHSKRHRRGKAEDLPGSAVYVAGKKATEVEGRPWTMRNEGLVGALQAPTLMTHPWFPGHY